VRNTPVAIYGAGGFAREVAWLVEACAGTEALRVDCFIDDDPGAQGSVLNDVPVLSLHEAARRDPRPQVVAGVGDPRLRERLMAQAAQAGMGFTTLIHPRVERSRWLEIGEGTVICAGNILTTNIRIGRHVQINLDCTIGHDVAMGDFATLAPGVHISGCVRIQPYAYVGTGAVVLNGTREKPVVIGEAAVVGAGACVTRSVPPGVTVAGVPAKPLERK